MTFFSDEYVSAPLLWRGIEIKVRYASHWCGRDYTAHLELHVISPPKAMIPVTETGYRSHFIPCGVIEDHGGPVAYATDWLNEAAKSKTWIAAEQASRQGSLF